MSVLVGSGRSPGARVGVLVLVGCSSCAYAQVSQHPSLLPSIRAAGALLLVKEGRGPGPAAIPRKRRRTRSIW